MLSGYNEEMIIESCEESCMSKQKVLIIEDEKQIARVIELELRHEGYDLHIEYDGLSGLQSVTVYAPDIILLDLMLPGLDGMEICRKVREFSAVPILMLTARDETVDKVAGLDTGANDYVTKPFAMEELLARIRALLRTRSIDPAEKLLKAGPLIMDLTRHAVIYDGLPVQLTKREFDLLEYFLRNQGLLLTRQQILDAVWGMDYEGDANVVDVYIRYLRGKIDDEHQSKLIHTVRGFGYRMEEREG